MCGGVGVCVCVCVCVCVWLALLNTHHVFRDLVLSIEFLQVFLRPLLLWIGSQVCLNQIVNDVVLPHTLHSKSTLRGEGVMKKRREERVR